MKEIKFIILRDKQGKLRHFKSDFLQHYTLARDNGFDSDKILESGIILEGRIFILDCIIQAHLSKTNKFILGNNYQDIKLEVYNKSREAESRYLYQYAGLKEGD